MIKLADIPMTSYLSTYDYNNKNNRYHNSITDHPWTTTEIYGVPSGYLT